MGLDAVTYKGHCCAVPTLHCANFLIELISGDAEVQEEILCSLETGNHNLGDLKEVVKKYHKLFSGVSPLVGDFRGKWTLPCFYLDAFIDKHGADSVQGVDAPIDEPDVLDNMKWFMKLMKAPMAPIKEPLMSTMVLLKETQILPSRTTS